MGTASMIARKIGEGFEGISCNYDGYPEHHAPILARHYATDEAVITLLDLGNLSILAPEIGEAHDFGSHNKNPKAEKWCLSYGRDRDEKHMAKMYYATEADLLAAASDHYASYAYLFQDGRWFVRKMNPADGWKEVR